MRYQVEISKEFEQPLLIALDFYMRLGLFQTEQFREMLLCGYFTSQQADGFLSTETMDHDVVDILMEQLDAIKAISGRSTTEFDGIRNPNVNLKAKTCYEIQKHYKDVQRSSCKKVLTFARSESILGSENYNLTSDYVFNNESDNIKLSLSLEQWKAVVSALSAFVNFGIGNYEYILKLFKLDVLTFKRSELRDSHKTWEDLKSNIKKIENYVPCNKDYMSIMMLDNNHILYKSIRFINRLIIEINKETTLCLRDGDYYAFKYNGVSCCGIFVSDGLGGGAFFNQGKVIALASDPEIERIKSLYDNYAITTRGDTLLANETVAGVCSSF